MVSPRASRACSARAVCSETMNANVRSFAGANVSRCPHRTSVSSSPYHALRWFCA
jgi:hypothetical protein